MNHGNDFECDWKGICNTIKWITELGGCTLFISLKQFSPKWLDEWKQDEFRAENQNRMEKNLFHDLYSQFIGFSLENFLRFIHNRLFSLSLIRSKLHS